MTLENTMIDMKSLLESKTAEDEEVLTLGLKE